MHRTAALLLLCGASAALYLAQSAGIVFYERYALEIVFAPSHFLGGLCVGLAAVYASHVYGHRLLLWQCLLAVLCVGIGWEVWEYSWAQPIPAWDTALDIVMDLLGGYVAYTVSKRL